MSVGRCVSVVLLGVMGRACDISVSICNVSCNVLNIVLHICRSSCSRGCGKGIIQAQEFETSLGN